MTPQLTGIWRYPVKSHGRESLGQVQLSPGATLPGDRIWAVAHDRSEADGSAWAPCVNFSRGAKAPALMAITAQLDDATGHLTLSHPDLPPLHLDPHRTPGALIDWVRPLVPDGRAAPARLVAGPGRGWTDSAEPSVTLCNMVSHRAVEQRAGRALSPARWRGNLWLDGLAPWEEFDWIGREVQIGPAVLRPYERTDRCLATTANPETGQRDIDMLAVLGTWGHQDFSVRAEVIRGGLIRPGDAVRVL